MFKTRHCPSETRLDSHSALHSRLSETRQPTTLLLVPAAMDTRKLQRPIAHYAPRDIAPIAASTNALHTLVEPLKEKHQYSSSPPLRKPRIKKLQEDQACRTPKKLERARHDGSGPLPAYDAGLKATVVS